MQTMMIVLASNLCAAFAVLAVLSRMRTRPRRAAPMPDTDTITLPAPDYAAMQDDHAALRAIAEDAPVLIWCEDPDGRITWANGAYRDMLDSAGLNCTDEEAAGELRALFPPTAPRAAGAPASSARRASVDHPREPRKWWFDCQSLVRPNGEVLNFALHANPVVRAEEALRNFVQTLTMTFAHLPTGLAVFDRKRQLGLFNPALSELTRLEPEWLSARPTLYAFLDRLRDMRMMPEPKDYKSWRQRLAELEQAAADGTYEETWPLPSGQTYRIIGRPHPEGAVAFLIEDITAEISLKRRFRAELELSQSVIDNLPEAVAVFSPEGRLVVSNTAYADLWGSDPATMLGELSITEATRDWQTRCPPSPVWGDLRDFATRCHDRAEWAADLELNDGRPLRCRFAPLARGATLCLFTAQPAPAPATRPMAIGAG